MSNLSFFVVAWLYSIRFVNLPGQVSVVFMFCSGSLLPSFMSILNLYLLAGKPYLTIHACLNEGCGLHVARYHTILRRCHSLAARRLFGLMSCGNSKSLAAAFMILLSLG